jgi:hypothetical protein
LNRIACDFRTTAVVIMVALLAGSACNPDKTVPSERSDKRDAPADSTSATQAPPATDTQPASMLPPPKPRESDIVYDFDEEGPGDEPYGWTFTETFTSIRRADWVVAPDLTAPSPDNTLCLFDSRNREETFNLALAQNSLARDLALSCKIKDSGDESAGAGMVWRYLDEQNYYCLRLSPAEQDVRIYKVFQGELTELGRAEAAWEKTTDYWRPMHITMQGIHIRCFNKDKLILESHDADLSQAGMIGVWTQGATLTSFDDIRWRESPEPN